MSRLGFLLRPILQDTFVWNSLQRIRDRERVTEWEKTGRPNTVPHFIKRQLVAQYAERYPELTTFIETGTYLGDMVYAMRDRFQKIISIELSNDLANRAQRRFREYRHIQIVRADSGEALPGLLATITAPCLFWLDGHPSGGMTAGETGCCPINNEVNAILTHGNDRHVILIDDAASFNGTDGYPTLDQMRELVARKRPHFKMVVSDHMIQIFRDDAAGTRNLRAKSGPLIPVLDH